MNVTIYNVRDSDSNIFGDVYLVFETFGSAPYITEEGKAPNFRRLFSVSRTNIPKENVVKEITEKILSEYDKDAKIEIHIQ